VKTVLLNSFFIEKFEPKDVDGRKKEKITDLHEKLRREQFYHPLN